MSVKQMLRTLDSEEFTLQMAYDLVEAEDLHRPPGVPPPAPPPDHLPTTEELVAKLEKMWGPVPKD
jgi:hypothetical protein